MTIVRAGVNSSIPHYFAAAFKVPILWSASVTSIGSIPESLGCVCAGYLLNRGMAPRIIGVQQLVVVICGAAVMLNPAVGWQVAALGVFALQFCMRRCLDTALYGAAGGARNTQRSIGQRIPESGGLHRSRPGGPAVLHRPGSFRVGRIARLDRSPEHRQLPADSVRGPGQGRGIPRHENVGQLLAGLFPSGVPIPATSLFLGVNTPSWRLTYSRQRRIIGTKVALPASVAVERDAQPFRVALLAFPIELIERIFEVLEEHAGRILRKDETEMSLVKCWCEAE